MCLWLGQDWVLPGGRGRGSCGHRRVRGVTLFRVHIDHVLDALQTSWAVVRWRIPPVSGMKWTRMLKKFRFLETLSGCQARQRLSIVQMCPLYLHIRGGFIIYGRIWNWLIIDWGSATVQRRDGSWRAGVWPVQEWTGVASIRRYQTKAAIAGFSYMTWVSSYFSRRGCFISLIGAHVSSLGLVTGVVQNESTGFAVCTLLQLLLQCWAVLATVHAVHLHQHGCFRARYGLPSLRSIPGKEKLNTTSVKAIKFLKSK